MLSISPSQIEAIHQHCESVYPYECCGALVGRSDGGWNLVSRLHPLRNAEPDAPERRFIVDPRELNSLDRALRDEGERLSVVGFYHSHPDSPARPSSVDLEWAWEGYSYMIVSVVQGNAADMRSYRLNEHGSRAKFVEEPIESA